MQPGKSSTCGATTDPKLNPQYRTLLSTRVLEKKGTTLCPPPKAELEVRRLGTTIGIASPCSRPGMLQRSNSRATPARTPALTPLGTQSFAFSTTSQRGAIQSKLNPVSRPSRATGVRALGDSETDTTKPTHLRLGSVRLAVPHDATALERSKSAINSQHLVKRSMTAAESFGVPKRRHQSPSDSMMHRRLAAPPLQERHNRDSFVTAERDKRLLAQTGEEPRTGSKQPPQYQKSLPVPQPQSLLLSQSSLLSFASPPYLHLPSSPLTNRLRDTVASIRSKLRSSPLSSLPSVRSLSDALPGDDGTENALSAIHEIDRNCSLSVLFSSEGEVDATATAKVLLSDAPRIKPMATAHSSSVHSLSDVNSISDVNSVSETSDNHGENPGELKHCSTSSSDIELQMSSKCSAKAQSLPRGSSSTKPAGTARSTADRPVFMSPQKIEKKTSAQVKQPATPSSRASAGASTKAAEPSTSNKRNRSTKEDPIDGSLCVPTVRNSLLGDGLKRRGSASPSVGKVLGGGTMLPASAKFRKDGFILSHTAPISDFYEVAHDNQLGQGSYGYVYQAKKKATDVIRAVKVIKKNKLKSIERFISEIDIMKTLNHPNILKLYETFEDEDNVYLALELCTGGELFDRIMAAGRFEEAYTASLMRQILSGLCYCHLKCVCHRDLKPENFLFQDETPEASIKIIDFGLATISPIPPAVLTTKAGTPFYVAPEVLHGSYRRECDLWSVGVIMYVLLCGYPPFFGNTDAEVLQRIKVGKFDFPKKEWGSISAGAKRMIRRLLCYDPESRLSAEQALKQEWLKAGHEKIMPSATINARLLTNFKAFRERSAFQQAVLTVVARDLQDDKISELRELFTALDSDGDGVLTVDEIIDGLNGCGMVDEITREELGSLLCGIDSDGSGNIDYSEFLAAAIGEEHYGADDEGLFRAAFGVFDMDSSGKINAEEIEELLSGHITDPKVRKETLDEMSRIVREVDQNGDGEIDFDEFRQMMLTPMKPRAPPSPSAAPAVPSVLSIVSSDSSG